MYQCQTDPEDRVSMSTVLRVWHERWEKILPFRHVGQGKRCRICARLDEERVQAVTLDARAAILERTSYHIKEVCKDREMSIRANRVAEQHAQTYSSDGLNQIVKITGDGMDQAKYKCQRNLASSAE